MVVMEFMRFNMRPIIMCVICRIIGEVGTGERWGGTGGLLVGQVRGRGKWRNLRYYKKMFQKNL